MPSSRKKLLGFFINIKLLITFLNKVLLFGKKVVYLCCNKKDKKWKKY